MNILLIGASGRTGSEILADALRGGHVVTAFTRDSSKFSIAGDRVRLFQGDVLDAEAVARAVPGHDAVVSALGADDPKSPGSTLSRGITSIISAMQGHGVRRLIAMSGAGILQLDERRLRRDSPDFPPFLQPISAEHQRVWEVARASDVDWTLVCCPLLPRGERTGRYRVLDSYLPEGGASISLEDAADFIYGQLTDTRFHRRRVGIAY